MDIENQREHADDRYRETMEVVRYCAARMTGSDRTLTTDDLYDESGLPG